MYLRSQASTGQTPVFDVFWSQPSGIFAMLRTVLESASTVQKASVVGLNTRVESHSAPMRGH